MLRSRRGGRRQNDDTAELNITAFMNLMVILVPFLLITAVFSRLARSSSGPTRLKSPTEIRVCWVSTRRPKTAMILML